MKVMLAKHCLKCQHLEWRSYIYKTVTYPYNAEIFLYNHEEKGFFQFEIIINVLVTSFCFS